MSKHFLFLVVCILLLYSCNNKNGFSLQQFDIQNKQLSSLIHSFADSIGKREEVPVIVLHHLDSFPAFYFVFAEKEAITPMHIFMNNRRIVGYIKTKSKDVIVLTTINSEYNFRSEFYKFLIPTIRTKKFDFIYFPNDMYCINYIPDEKGIPYPPILFEPNYKVYIYKNNEFEIYSLHSP